MKDIALILGILFCACSTSKKGSTETNSEKKFSDNQILGRWCSQKSTAEYPHLTFRQDGYVIFDCKIDTVFGLKYTIDDNYLLVIPTDKPVNRNRILKLTQDSLILETLLELQVKQVYYRCNKK